MSTLYKIISMAPSWPSEASSEFSGPSSFPELALIISSMKPKDFLQLSLESTMPQKILAELLETNSFADIGLSPADITILTRLTSVSTISTDSGILPDLTVNKSLVWPLYTQFEFDAGEKWSRRDALPKSILDIHDMCLTLANMPMGGSDFDKAGVLVTDILGHIQDFILSGVLSKNPLEMQCISSLKDTDFFFRVHALHLKIADQTKSLCHETDVSYPLLQCLSVLGLSVGCAKGQVSVPLELKDMQLVSLCKNKKTLDSLKEIAGFLELFDK